MLGFKVIKNKLFGGKDEEVPAADQFYSPLRIGLHSTINVSMIDWLTAKSDLNGSVILPQGSMSILAIGSVDVDSDKIFNIYLMDEALEQFSLQIFCSPNDKGQGMEVREVTLYREVRNVSPQSEEEWNHELYSVGDPSYVLDGQEYKRVWSDNTDAKIDLVPFEETVIRLEETIHYTNNYVLYARDISVAPVHKTELLLIGVEESEDTAELVNRIGLVVPTSAISVQ